MIMSSTKSTNTISKSILINSPASTVWEHLTIPSLMKEWMLDTDAELEIISEWRVGSSIIMKGAMHDINFENKGTILKYDTGKTFEYSHLSSISQLPEVPENFCILTFTLSPVGTATALNLTITNFPTDSIYKHMEFYWRTVIEILKKQLERL